MQEEDKNLRDLPPTKDAVGGSDKDKITPSGPVTSPQDPALGQKQRIGYVQPSNPG